MRATEWRRPWMALGLAIMLFVSGLATGLALRPWLVPRGGRHGPFGPPPPPGELAEKLRRDLGLDPAQVASLRPILQQNWVKMAEILLEVEPKAEALRADTETRIRALLRAEQQTRYAALLERLHRKRAGTREQLEKARQGGL